MDKTATEIKMKEFERKRLDQSVHAFIQRWAPEDPEEAAMFHTHFHSVVRDIYGDMQRPVTEVLTSVLLQRPVPPTILKGHTDG
jgi:hypothetical protein